MISPTEFIPLAEDTGLIVEIGKQVLHKACVECRHWPGNTAVAVNFSPIQFVEVLPLPANAGLNRMDHIAFNTAERWSEDVSEHVAQELRRRCDLSCPRRW
jgi:EAL domain-containing protein (putative c-di-GMP-specific phosphodiesterase class I)